MTGAMPSKAEGRVAFFNGDKGYGFIIPDAGGPDVFVHLYSLPDGIDELEKGQRVRYDLRESSRKPGQLAVRMSSFTSIHCPMALMNWKKVSAFGTTAREQSQAGTARSG
jgi:cold shock CspA family protein